jgi:hypothetical protein
MKAGAAISAAEDWMSARRVVMVRLLEVISR